MNKNQIKRIINKAFHTSNPADEMTEEELLKEAELIDLEMADVDFPELSDERQQEMLDELHEMIDYYEVHKSEYLARRN